MEDYRKIAINGYVTIKNGDTVIVEKGQNAIVRQGMRYFFALMTFNYVYAINSSPYHYKKRQWNGPSYMPYIRFGKGNNPTTQLMDTLESEIALSQTSLSNTYGAYNAGLNGVLTLWVASWTSGSLNSYLTEEETLGEVGLWLNLETDWGLGNNLIPELNSSFGGDIYYTSPSLMFARFGLGDKAFVPNPTSPIVVEWEFRWVFV